MDEGAYAKMAGVGGGAAGGEDPFYSASAYGGAEKGHRQRMRDLYGQLEQINQQYGQAAELPDHVVDKIHILNTHLNQAINHWEEYKGKARTATTDQASAQEQAKSAQSYRSLVQGGQVPAGQTSASPVDQLEMRASGPMSNTPIQGRGMAAPRQQQKRPPQQSPVGPYADMLLRKGPQFGFRAE